MGKVGMFQIGGLGVLDGMVGYTLAMYNDLSGTPEKNVVICMGFFPTPNLCFCERFRLRIYHCPDPCKVRKLPSEK